MASGKDKIYRGRFAPSPTGPLHIGSLIAAVGSYLQAKTQDGQWLLRIEDLDPPREAVGATESIIKTLDEYGFEWDEEISYQSRRHDLYEQYIEQLRKDELIYHCNCSRKQINSIAKAGLNGPIYPRTCYTSKHHHQGSLRFLTSETSITFIDAVQGKLSQNVAGESGDFVIKRADGLYNYQLAVVIDDFEQGITEVVRGSDLLNLTASQINLQQALGFTTPQYLHMPVVVNQLGQKLSKQTQAPAISKETANQSLWYCLNFLGQQPPAELQTGAVEEIWQWAKSHWRVDKIPRVLTQGI